ncbi:ABC transporter ATP-binding protein [Methanospirillum purgamenti]|jgi:putative ABC transport system ATP-binding protein|uniref:ABC transporter ATP-binding protein n=1 Tax=Methanospirillum hungatei TaxID=2203 RepID=A0A8F5VLV9_METHU|nr:ABC transporter ATP-binding protein [Methanospirillum hungatei]QXO94526.1 ABC transporter ATP-binding protein [Methanospirillum hungatei]
MIETCDLIKTYQMGDVSIHALRGVSVRIHKGEFVGIMGPSGSGKSTFLHLTGLLDSQTSGKVLISGTDVSLFSNEKRSQFRLETMGYVFQDYALIEDLTVVENIAVPGLGLGMDFYRVMDRAMMLAEEVGLSGRSGHLKRELSGGQQQRVAIARALMNEPAIVFADEPCANLDTSSSRMVLDLFKRLNQEYGQTIVMVSHEPWHEEYFDRVIRFMDGTIDT